MTDSFLYGLRLTRPRRDAAGLSRQQRGLPGMLDAQLLERRGQACVRLGRLIELVPAGGELGGEGMPLRPLHKRPADRQGDEGGQADRADQPSLAQKRDHGASSISAAFW
jgi:hypothetical protein